MEVKEQCANCGSQKYATTSICVTWDLDQRGRSNGQREVSVSEAISSIFFYNIPTKSNDERFGNALTYLCLDCSEILTVLYNSFCEFNHLRDAEREIGERLSSVKASLEDYCRRETAEEIKTHRVLVETEIKEEQEIEDELNDDLFFEMDADGDFNDLPKSPSPSPTPVRKSARLQHYNIKKTTTSDDDDEEESAEDEAASDEDYGMTEEDDSDSEYEINCQKSPINHPIKVKRESNFCCVCSKNFATPKSLRRHKINIHHVRTDKPQYSPGFDENLRFRCNGCPKTFSSEKILKSHLQFCGSFVQCNICEKRFCSDYTKNTHVARIHGENKQTNFPCPVENCNKQYTLREDLSAHIKSTHPDFVLKKVPKATKENTTKEKPEKIPQKRKKSSLKPKIPCPECGKMVRPDNFKDHLATHSEERNFLCPKCGKSFRIRATLSNHIRDIHENNGKHKCEKCNLTFCRSSVLRIHMESIHTEGDPFMCSACGKSFLHLKNLRQHMKTHDDSGACKCPLCGKVFSRPDNVRSHIKSVHQGQKIERKSQVIGPSRRTLSNKRKEIASAEDSLN